MADSSKTEKATPQHRTKARQLGQVARSRELSNTLALAAVAGILSLIGPQAIRSWGVFFHSALDSATVDPVQANGPLLFWTSVEVFRWILPIFVCALAVSLAAGVAQGGFVFAPEALSPKFERMNPGGKLQQMFSAAALSTALKSLAPFAAIAWVGYDSIRSHWNALVLSSFESPRAFAKLAGGMLLDVGWKSGLVLLIWAGVDYMLLWFKHEGDLKMSQQEIREELKESEGNPANKSRIRRLQRQNRRRQMIKAAERATVVITNPTHYAVALRYDQETPTPVVVAKGLDLLAEKIKQIARDRDIPMMENRPLAQALYKGAEVGDAIPSALYHAVAEVLVLVYRAQAEVRERDARRQQSEASGR